MGLEPLMLNLWIQNWIYSQKMLLSVCNWTRVRCYVKQIWLIFITPHYYNRDLIWWKSCGYLRIKSWNGFIFFKSSFLIWMEKKSDRKMSLILVSMNLKIWVCLTLKGKINSLDFILVFDFSYFVVNDLRALWWWWWW